MRILVPDAEMLAEVKTCNPRAQVEIAPPDHMIHKPVTDTARPWYMNTCTTQPKGHATMSKKNTTTAAPATTTAPSTTPPPPPAPSAPVASAAPAVAKDTKNGVTRPKAGTTTGRVWEVADAISQKKNDPATRAEVIAGCEGINESTVATQYGKWRKYHGLKRPAKVEAPAAPAAQAPAANVPPPPPAPPAPVADDSDDADEDDGDDE